ncbi:MAG: 4Fe-4S binding protein [Oscillospiraceae bacterium]|nr:4Fe-4S binding protein [Oscillospiraceae bacterium]
MDNNNASWRQTCRPLKRRLIQLYAALLYNAQAKGFVTGKIYTGKAKAVCVPGLNCYSCPGAVGACPLGALQNALGHSGSRIGFYVFGILMLYGLILGRTICGWLCPFGLVQELLHKLPTPKLKKSRVTRALSYLKYLVLAVFAAAIPIWYELRRGIPVPGFCKYICPAGTLEGAMLLLPNRPEFLSMLGPLFTGKFVILVLVVLASIFCHRAFCRFFCPLGAIYGLFNRIAVVGVKVEPERCSGCGACVRACPMDVRAVGDRECVSCGRCMDVCARKAISLKAGGYTLLAPDAAAAPETVEHRARGRRLAWIAALAALCFALAWFNVIEPARAGTDVDAAQSAQTSTETPAEADARAAGAAVGAEVGQQLADFTIQCLDGSTFRLSETRGKVVIINLWATYCGPCVKELPHFDALARAHKDDLAMLAVHAGDVVDDVGAFLDGREFDIPFAIDSEDGALFAVVNGSEALPQTIVLNRRGEVVYNQVGSVSPELLEQLYEQAAAQ